MPSRAEALTDREINRPGAWPTDPICFGEWSRRRSRQTTTPNDIEALDLYQRRSMGKRLFNAGLTRAIDADTDDMHGNRR